MSLKLHTAADILNIEPGMVLVYHRGHLSRDRGGDRAKHRGASQTRVDNVARAAMQMAEAGHIKLMQRRLPNRLSVFEYVAVGVSI